MEREKQWWMQKHHVWLLYSTYATDGSSLDESDGRSKDVVKKTTHAYLHTYTQKGKEWEEKMNRSLENVEIPHKQDSLTLHYSLSLLIQTFKEETN